jgi:RNA polymerase sigma factor (sigma-70 family)
VDAPGEAAAAIPDREAPLDFDAVFHLYYPRVARLIGRVVRDQGRAEELAAEVFWRLWHNRRIRGENAAGWLYRTAVRSGLYELRRLARRERVAHLLGRRESPPDPEQMHAAAQERQQVRAVLERMDKRRAELLLLRSSGLSYEELAAALELNPASVGTLLSRAQQAFRKEYIKLYGQP